MSVLWAPVSPGFAQPFSMWTMRMLCASCACIACACCMQAGLGLPLCLPNVTEKSRAATPGVIALPACYTPVLLRMQFSVTLHPHMVSRNLISEPQHRLQSFLLFVSLFLKVLNQTSQGLTVGCCWYLAAFGTSPGLHPTVSFLT